MDYCVRSLRLLGSENPLFDVWALTSKQARCCAAVPFILSDKLQKSTAVSTFRKSRCQGYHLPLLTCC
eukprot:scaffold158327_cov14-Tisochrysis_lutea.AAC.1